MLFLRSVLPGKKYTQNAQRKPGLPCWPSTWESPELQHVRNEFLKILCLPLSGWPPPGPRHKLCLVPDAWCPDSWASRTVVLKHHILGWFFFYAALANQMTCGPVTFSSIVHVVSPLWNLSFFSSYSSWSCPYWEILPEIPCQNSGRERLIGLTRCLFWLYFSDVWNHPRNFAGDNKISQTK